MGDSFGPQSLIRRMAPFRNWRRSISDVPGGVLPTKSSRFILSCAACWAARMEERAVGTEEEEEDGGWFEDREELGEDRLGRE